MSRRTLSEKKGQSTNPAKRFLNWKSNDKEFAYYDKEKNENISVPLPFKFQFLEHFSTVKGWNDANQTGIYSNEVMFTSKEEINVRMFNGMEVAKGIYSDIRSKVRDAGGKYHRSVYALDEKGDIINIQMKGSVVSAYSVFMDGDKKANVKGHKHLIENNWIIVKEFQSLKKGATKYTVPIFEIGDAFTTEEFALANEKYKDIEAYYKKYSSGIESNVEVEAEAEETVIDDLEF